MSVLENVTKDPVKLGVAVIIVVGGLYYFGRRAVADAAAGVASVANAAKDVALDVVDGRNAITEGARTTAYQNAGVVGTAAALTDRASGGFFSSIGEWIGGKVYEVTHPEWNAPASGQSSTVAGGKSASPKPIPAPGSLSGQGIW